MELRLLEQFAVIAALGVAVSVLLSRLKVPTVAGLLVAGAVAGPHGFALIDDSRAIGILAEIGVVLLLFTIGLEFSLERLRYIFGRVALGALLQVVLTVAVVTCVFVALGHSLQKSIFFGFVFAMSSTAIVLTALTERQEIDAPHGRFIVGTLIFQDLCVIPMVLIVPLLVEASSPTMIAKETALALLKAAGVVISTVVVARMLVPPLLNWVAASRSREVFLLAVLGLCIGTASLTLSAGLSLALGAFLGGMIVAGTEYGHRAMAEVMPLRDTFVSIFFISLGMLFDVRVAFEQPALVGTLFLGFLLGKGFLATLAAMSMRFPARVAWLAGVGLAQFGEFGFVLARLAESSGVIDATATGPLLSAGILSMFVTPMLVRVAPHVTAGERLLAPLERLIGARAIDEVSSERDTLEQHVVIVGYGLAGKQIARALAASGIRYLVLELNTDTVRACAKIGEPIYYGDATSLEVLSHARVERARAVVVVISDPNASRRVVDAVPRVAPHVPVLIRTRYLAESAEFTSLGAAEVIAEEVEGAVELIARLLRRFELPRNVIDARIHETRELTRSSTRPITVPRLPLRLQKGLEDLKIESLLIEDGTIAAGRSPVDLGLRRATGALVVAIRREGRLLENPDLDAAILPGDVVYLVGSLASVTKAIDLLTRPLDVR